MPAALTIRQESRLTAPPPQSPPSSLSRFFQPESEAEVEQFLRCAARSGARLRVSGSMLSPNGMSLSKDGMLSMALMDKVVQVDAKKQQVGNEGVSL